jgi:tRNA (adenine22-N1)-methyltransferase
MLEITLEKLSPRLFMISQMVKGTVLADVGTDHAYLPIALMREKRIVRAVASDVHKGPITRAKENVLQNNFSDEITVLLTDGLTGLHRYTPTDIVIAGMGGDLIAKILDSAPWAKDAQYHFILQPMTKAHHLRKYLYDNGFAINEECFAKEEMRVYLALSCRYRGEKERYTDLDCYTGKTAVSCPNPIHAEYLAQIRSVFQKRMAGMAFAETVEKEEIAWLKDAIETLTKSIEKRNAQ